MSERTAVVLFNLGGPDSLAAVRPFLMNLFSDPAILRMPAPLRWLLARLIVARRSGVAREIYSRIGGASPILKETQAQADALAAALGDSNIAVFPSMRYWHPMTEEVVRQVAAFAPDRIVLLPLYPQFSSTTTGSSFVSWETAAKKAGLGAPVTQIRCYPDEAGFVEALAARTREALQKLPGGCAYRILFSAHGLPKKIVDGGDPYQEQVERTVAALVQCLGPAASDHVICYQSRVGPAQWLEPYTDVEIKRAGADGVAVVVVPVAFVSEHSETLVELDMDYADLARDHGVPGYARALTVGTHPSFIAALAGLVSSAGGGAR